MSTKLNTTMPFVIFRKLWILRKSVNPPKLKAYLLWKDQLLVNARNQLVNEVFFSRCQLEEKNSEAGIAGLQVTSRRPCWWSRTKAFLSTGK